ncbi:hypothetical protein [Marinibacterium sp. SX1]|uniref:hypothetical protein n=1 Tax=Marinibacterium sp. SX1 TaxID=3388424 RepID=UPI003D17DFB3
MQFVMEAGGYKVVEKMRLKSSKKYVELSGDATFSWKNEGIAAISDKSRGAYLAEVGKTIQSAYKKALTAVTKAIQALIDGVEKKMMAMELAFTKKHAKSPPTGKEVEAALKQMNAFKDSELVKIGAEAQKLYQEAVARLTRPAHEAGCKKIQEGATLKKDHGKLAWTLVKFVVVATAIAFATVATIATGGAAAVVIVAAAALITKGLSLIVSTAKDLTAYAKQYRANVAIAADEVATAEKAIDKALKAIEAANANHEAMTLKVGQVKQEFLVAIKKLDGDKSGDKKVQEARKNLEQGQSDILKFETQLGGKPADVLAALKTAKQDLVKAQPRKVPDLDTSNRWADFFKNAADVTSSAVKAF